MKCPYCGSKRDRVVETRESKDGAIIRRRRECLNCHRRFTSYEEIEESFPLVVKRDGRREKFSREKILAGITKACEKRPIPLAKIKDIVEEIERISINKGGEIKSSEIGEMVMEKLRNLDKVAYIRFASVYRRFEDVESFVSEITSLLSSPRKNN